EKKRTEGFTSVSSVPSVVNCFQETELGPLPAHWKVVRLGEVVVFERGISWSKREESKLGVGIVGIPNIRDGKVDLSPRAFISKRVSPDKMLHEGDILLVGSSGSIDNVGRVGVVEEAPTVPTTYASFTVRARAIADAVDQQFLAYLLSSERVPFSQFAKRAADGKYNLQVQQLRDYALALPPLEEQRAIASILKAVDAKIAAERARRDALETLFKTLLHELMTGKRRAPCEVNSSAANRE
ncbi:MAG: restriction endonuclease subunit S, partial [Fimbriimonadales bacterium]|nr:restriction endonuclease subunit S [Fimbriimonadales bacterium]